MIILKQIKTSLLSIKKNITNIFLYDCKEYVKERRENILSWRSDAYCANEKMIYREKCVFALLFLLIFSVLGIYYIYIDLKDNIQKNNVPLAFEPLNIKIDSPTNKARIEDFNILNYKIHSGDVFIDILTKKAAINYSDAYKVISVLNKLYNLKSLKVGQNIQLKYKTEIKNTDDNIIDYNNILEELRIENKEQTEQIIITRENGGYVGKIVKTKLHKQYEKYEVVITSNLYSDGIAVGIPPSIMLELINHFSFDIDFARDIQDGSKLEVLFETFYSDNGLRVRYGDIIFSSIKINNYNFVMYKYNSAKYGGIYFDEVGTSLKKSLLKTPINGARISSGFNPNRKHPVLGYTRAHKGIDFAAPTGTPFFASGDGTIVVMKKGWNGGYGNYIKIRHNSTYQTLYAHISKFNPRFKTGSKVKQGDIIAYVGATGVATGPHLHYEVLFNNKHINPATIKSVPSIKLSGKDLIDFNTYKEKIDFYRNNLQIGNRQ